MVCAPFVFTYGHSTKESNNIIMLDFVQICRKNENIKQQQQQKKKDTA